MKRLLKRIAVKVLSRITEGKNSLEYYELSQHELNALAVRSLVGINRSLYVLARNTVGCEDCEEEESSIPYPRNNRPTDMIV